MRTIYILLLLFYVNGVHGQDLEIPQNVRYLALGDSYTIGESVNEPFRWPSQFRDSLIQRGYQFDTLEYIATTGWTTQSLLNAVTNQSLEDKNFNLVSVLIGVNNQYQGQPFSLFLSQFPQLLDSAIVYAGGDTSAVFVLSIPDYAYTPFGQTMNPNGISQEIDEYNAAKDSICQEYGIKYFNITPISREGLNDPALVASDGLHPSREQYTLWVQEVLVDIPNQTANTLNESKKDPIRLYPNPARTQVFLDHTEPFASYTICDLSGKEVLESSVVGDQIPVDSLPNSTYVLRLIDEAGKISRLRLVIER
ncbi:MAG: GDSL-type esterase/lipase family protein [Fluviicola sp.]